MRWMIYNQAKMWSKKPSEIIGIKCGYIAYDFDMAIGMFGSFVERRIDDVELTESEKKQRNAKGTLRKKINRKINELLGNWEPNIATLEDMRKRGYVVVNEDGTVENL